MKKPLDTPKQQDTMKTNSTTQSGDINRNALNPSEPLNALSPKDPINSAKSDKRNEYQQKSMVNTKRIQDNIEEALFKDVGRLIQKEPKKTPPTKSAKLSPYQAFKEKDNLPTLTNPVSDEYRRGWIESKLEYLKNNRNILNRAETKTELASSLLAEADKAQKKVSALKEKHEDLNNKTEKMLEQVNAEIHQVKSVNQETHQIREELEDLLTSARLEQKQRHKMNMLHINVVKKLESLRDELSQETSEAAKTRLELQESIDELDKMKQDHQINEQRLKKKFNQHLTKHTDLQQSEMLVGELSKEASQEIDTSLKETQRALDQMSDDRHLIQKSIQEAQTYLQNIGKEKSQIKALEKEVKSILEQAKSTQSVAASQLSESQSALYITQNIAKTTIDKETVIKRLSQSIENQVNLTQQTRDEIIAIAKKVEANEKRVVSTTSKTDEQQINISQLSEEASNLLEKSNGLQQQYSTLKNELDIQNNKIIDLHSECKEQLENNKAQQASNQQHLEKIDILTSLAAEKEESLLDLFQKVKALMNKDEQFRNQIVSSVRFTRRQNAETRTMMTINQNLVEEIKTIKEDSIRHQRTVEEVISTNEQTKIKITDEQKNLAEQINKNESLLLSAEALKKETEDAFAEQQASIAYNAEQHEYLNNKLNQKIKTLESLENEVVSLIQQEYDLKARIESEAEINQSSLEKFDLINLTLEERVKQFESAQQVFKHLMGETKKQITQMNNTENKNNATLAEIHVQMKQLDYIKQEFSNIFEQNKRNKKEHLEHMRLFDEKSIELKEIRDFTLNELDHIKHFKDKTRELLSTISNQVSKQNDNKERLKELEHKINQSVETVEKTHQKVEHSLSSNQNLLEQINQQNLKNRELKTKIETDFNEINKVNTTCRENLDAALLINNQIDQKSTNLEDKIKLQENLLTQQTNLYEKSMNAQQAQQDLNTEHEKLKTQIDNKLTKLNETLEEFRREREVQNTELTQHRDLVRSYDKKLESAQLLGDRLQSLVNTAGEQNEKQEAIKASLEKQFEEVDNYQKIAFTEQQKQRQHQEKLLEALSTAESNNHALMKTFEEMKRLRELDKEQIAKQQKVISETQQKQVTLEAKIKAVNEQNQKLNTLIKEANLHKRESKLASNESLHANKETKIILKELKQEIAELKTSLPTSFRQELKSETRINQLEERLTNNPEAPYSPPILNNQEIEKPSETKQDGADISTTDYSGSNDSEPVFKKFMI